MTRTTGSGIAGEEGLFENHGHVDHDDETAEEEKGKKKERRRRKGKMTERRRRIRHFRSTTILGHYI